MGAGASVKRSASSLRIEMDRLRERELNSKEENLKEWEKEEAKVSSKVTRLQNERNELAQKLAELEVSLAHEREGWKRERNKTLALTYNGLPLSLISEKDADFSGEKSNPSLAKNYPMVTLAQCDVAGFSTLTAKLKPQEVIRVIDHLHALFDEIYSSKEIFIMERNSDGCTAVSGLVETLLEETRVRDGSLSSVDSSYGSEFNLTDFETNKYYSRTKKSQLKSNQLDSEDLKTASYFATLLATSALNLMSSSSKIRIPLEEVSHLQLRIALHSGPCSAGILGLQAGLNSSRIPQFKVLGPSVIYTSNLCRTGLALQIRVSKQCKYLLEHSGDFIFERCPDYLAWDNRKPIESYWLVGKTDLHIKLPSLDLAIPLESYGDIDI